MQSTHTTISAMEHFEHWLDNRDRPGSRQREQLTHAAARPYRYIWKAWVQWLTTPSVVPTGDAGPALANCWTQAQPGHVMRYLDEGVEAAASARRGKSAPISEITRRRYWRVLQQIYAHAVNQHIIAINPVMSAADVTQPPQEDSEGLVLLGPLWQAVSMAIPRGTSRWDKRDRAILSVLMDAGLTTSELADIRLQQVGERMNEIPIRIVGPRGAQNRDVRLGTDASIELRQWMEERLRITPHPATDPELVFITNQGRPMSGRTLFRLVSTTVTRGMHDGGFPMPQHIGPQVLRNSRIVTWLNEGVPVEEVCQRAGFKDYRSLRGLRRHINPGVLPVTVSRRRGDREQERT